MRQVCFLFLLGCTVLAPVAAAAQAPGSIYGKVITKSGNTYQGVLRWGKEEAFWDDLFNATKAENPNLAYLNREDRERLSQRPRYAESWGGRVNRYLGDWGWNWSDNNTHQFVTRFGDIKSLVPKGNSAVAITLKNGETLDLKDGSNDVGTTIQVMDQSMGLVKLKWEQIERIDFAQAPANVAKSFGPPIHGTVKSRFGTFTGFIQWDEDEAVLSDELDGNTRDGEVSIAFEQINRIERMGNSSKVVLRDGRTLELRGSNDVNNENRGIVVKDAGFGRVKIKWEDFESLDLSAAPKPPADYDAYTPAKRLHGTVTTKAGKQFTGDIVYDLDETYDVEVVNGNRGESSEYSVPFRNVRRIEPKDDYSADIVLRNGDRIQLYDSQDVNSRNTGILVFDDGAKRYAYIAWDQVRSVEFQ